MMIDKNYRGRIRVEGKPGETTGYMLTVHDADTGEAIENVTDIALYIGVHHENRAYLTCRFSKNNNIETADSIADHEIDLTAIVDGFMGQRDTQFAGFAALLAAEIADTDGWKLADVEKLIAQRTYDLTQSFFEHHYGDEAPFKQEEIQRSIHMLPDPTSLPEQG